MTKFGPAGCDERFYALGYKRTVDAAKYCKDMDLDCFEYSFGRGVNISEGTAKEIADAFAREGVELTVHAPYYINLANPDDEMAEKSFGYILQSARVARVFGAKRITFHPATQGKMERAEAVSLTEERIKKLTDRIYAAGYEDLIFCPETMGKMAQIGTLEEVVSFCKTDKVYLPTVDFGHLNARERGSLKTAEDFEKRLEYMKAELGEARAKNFHCHFSKIMYGEKGEIKHLTFEDKEYGPEFEPYAKALKRCGMEPYVVCESAGTQALDSATMKAIYASVDT